MDCNYCTDPIELTGRDMEVLYDDAGMPYHYDCGMTLRSKFDDARQEQMAKEEADHENYFGAIG